MNFLFEFSDRCFSCKNTTRTNATQIQSLIKKVEIKNASFSL